MWRVSVESREEHCRHTECVYESVRPQIAVLWRVPGTTIYRNVKQESNGVFIPSVFIARIGSSLYFANASFVKDTLQTFVDSLQEVNRTEYLILEMTPVVTIDSSAAHAFHDIVSGFRSRGIQVAFAMVGNRVEKTMRKAKLKEYIGDQWFHPTVSEAVHYCLTHQRAKKAMQRSLGDDCEKAMVKDSAALPVDVVGTPISLGDEIGVTNDLHHAYTAVHVSLAVDIPTAMCEIASVFKRGGYAVAQATVTPLGDAGVKHVYFVWNLAKAAQDAESGGKKLTEIEIVALRSDLEVVIAGHRQLSILSV